MGAALERSFGDADFPRRSILIQGLGGVGLPLAGLLAEAGATLHLADVREDAVRKAQERFGGSAVRVEDMWD